MEIDVQPMCMSCCNGFHHAYYPGHSFALVNGKYPANRTNYRNYHPSVERNGYFKKDERAIDTLNCFSEKGLFSLLPPEIIQKIENYLVNYFCTSCVRNQPCNKAFKFSSMHNHYVIFTKHSNTTGYWRFCNDSNMFHKVKTFLEMLMTII